MDSWNGMAITEASSMWSLVLSAWILGIACAAVPGAVNTESVRRALHGGFRQGFLIRVGARVGDTLWAVLGLTGAAIFLQRDTLTGLLGLMSASLLLWLAAQALRDAFAPMSDDGSAPSGGALRVGLTFGLANPAGIAFWSGFGASMFGGATPSRFSLMLLLVFFVVGAAAWGASLAKVIAWGGKRAGRRLLPIVDAVSAVLLGWFGVRWLWSSMQRL